MMERIRDCCVELKMERYFVDWCARHQKYFEIDERRIDAAGSEVFVYGYAGFRFYIQRYLIASDSWVMIDPFWEPNSYPKHVHINKQHICFIIKYITNEIQV